MLRKGSVWLRRATRLRRVIGRRNSYKNLVQHHHEAVFAHDRHDLSSLSFVTTTAADTTSSTATTTMVTTMDGPVAAAEIHLPVSATQTALFLLRVLSPAVLLLSALSIITTRPPQPKSPSPITSVVVAARTPRRALILSLLSLSALTFLLDGLTFVVYTVFTKSWLKWTGIEVASVEGLVAFAGLAALGAWKDIHGVEVWFLKRVKAGVTWALLLDIAQVVLLGLTFRSEWPAVFSLFNLS